MILIQFVDLMGLHTQMNVWHYALEYQLITKVRVQIKLTVYQVNIKMKMEIAKFVNLEHFLMVMPASAMHAQQEHLQKVKQIVQR